MEKNVVLGGKLSRQCLELCFTHQLCSHFKFVGCNQVMRQIEKAIAYLRTKVFAAIHFRSAGKLLIN